MAIYIRGVLREWCPVSELLIQQIPATTLLAIAAIVLALLISVPAGFVAALNRGSVVDYLVTGMNGLAMAIPSFWLGLVLILIAAVTLHLLPVSGYVNPFQDPLDSAKHLILPAFTLAFEIAGVLARFTKSVVLDVLDSDYIRTGRGKGLPELVIDRRHVLPNALVTLVTILGLQFGRLLGGAVIIESVFAWPGVGLLLLNAVNNRDYLVVQGGLLLFVLLFMLINLLTDLTYRAIDPRVRLA